MQQSAAMPPAFRIRVSVTARDPTRFPFEDDDALGGRLYDLVCRAVVDPNRGPPRLVRPAMLTLQDDQIDQYDLAPFTRSDAHHRHRLLAAIAGQEDVRAVAVVGVLPVRLGRMPHPMPAASVFVEWPDNRWWLAWQFVDPREGLVGEHPVIRRAVDGWPKPGGIGGWFATARRLNLRLVLKPIIPDGAMLH